MRATSIVLAAVLLCGAGQARAEGAAPFVFEKAMLIPQAVPGPYTDYMTMDAAGELLFATPQAAKSVAVFDLKTQTLLKMIPGIGNPHGVVFDTPTKQLFVADSASGDVKVFQGDDYALVKTIPLDAGADWMIADPAKRLIYVNHGGADAKMDHSVISAIDPDTMAVVADIRIESVGMEQSAIDPATRLLYQNIKDKQAVVVVDLDKRTVVATWPLKNSRRPMTLAIDAPHQRLYLGCRDTDMRGSIDVIDLKTGQEVDRLALFGWVDSLYFDEKRQRIYASVGVGMIETYDVLADGKYAKAPSVDTAVMSKTSLFRAGSDRMYVSVPRLGSTPGQVMVFKAAP